MYRDARAVPRLTGYHRAALRGSRGADGQTGVAGTDGRAAVPAAPGVRGAGGKRQRRRDPAGAAASHDHRACRERSSPGSSSTSPGGEGGDGGAGGKGGGRKGAAPANDHARRRTAAQRDRRVQRSGWARRQPGPAADRHVPTRDVWGQRIPPSLAELINYRTPRRHSSSQQTEQNDSRRLRILRVPRSCCNQPDANAMNTIGVTG